MTPWLLVMFIVMSPTSQPEFIALSAKSEGGCEQRKHEFMENLPQKPMAFASKCVYMPPLMGTV